MVFLDVERAAEYRDTVPRTNSAANPHPRHWLFVPLVIFVVFETSGCSDRGAVTRQAHSEKSETAAVQGTSNDDLASRYVDHSKSWSVRLPDGWRGESVDIFDRFTSNAVPGEIRAGGVRKGSAGRAHDVTDSDLRDWVKEYVSGATFSTPALPVRCGDFVGLFHTFQIDDEYSRQWILRNGDLLVKFTYVCEPRDKGRYDTVVDAIIDTLRVNK